MAKFKIGDRVRVVDSSGNPSACVNGDTATVKELQGDDLVGAMSDRTGRQILMYAFRFELMIPKPRVREFRLRSGSTTPGVAIYNTIEEALKAARNTNITDKDIMVVEIVPVAVFNQPAAVKPEPKITYL